MKRIPYDELSIAKGDAKNVLSLSTPWVELEIEYEEQHEGVVAEALAWANCRDSSQYYSPAVDSILSYVDGYPLFYTVPRPDLTNEFPPPSDASAEAVGVNGIVDSGGRHDEKGETLWDEHLVLSLSRIDSSIDAHEHEEKYDPLSAFLLIQRMRLKSELLAQAEAGTKLLTVLETLLRTDDPRFYEAMSRIIAQNYFISLRSQAAIHPALRRTKTTPVLSHYLTSEQHHDRLLMDSIEKLGMRYSPSLILTETENIIRILTHAATNHFFSFCCMIDSFEGEIYEEEDVFASLIRKSRKPQAAGGLQKHFEINVNEEHFDVGRQLCLTMGALPRSEVVAAVRLTRACASLKAGMVQQLLRSIDPSVSV